MSIMVGFRSMPAKPGFPFQHNRCGSVWQFLSWLGSYGGSSHDVWMATGKKSSLSVKIDSVLFKELDDYYQVLQSVGYTKSGIVEEALKAYLLNLSELKANLDKRLKGIRRFEQH